VRLTQIYLLSNACVNVVCPPFSTISLPNIDGTDTLCQISAGLRRICTMAMLLNNAVKFEDGIVDDSFSNGRVGRVVCGAPVARRRNRLREQRSLRCNESLLPGGNSRCWGIHGDRSGDADYDVVKMVVARSLAVDVLSRRAPCLCQEAHHRLCIPYTIISAARQAQLQNPDKGQTISFSFYLFYLFIFYNFKARPFSFLHVLRLCPDFRIMIRVVL
jgi:hypothetical protein